MNNLISEIAKKMVIINNKVDSNNETLSNSIEELKTKLDEINDPPDYSIYYTFSDISSNTVEVTGLTEAGQVLTELNIPSTYNGKTVIRIGNNAFYDCDQIVSVIMPDTITTIGISAFEDCDNITYIKLPSSLKSLDDDNNMSDPGQDNFRDCSNLSSVEYKGVTYTDAIKLVDALRANNVICPYCEFRDTKLKNAN